MQFYCYGQFCAAPTDAPFIRRRRRSHMLPVRGRLGSAHNSVCTPVGTALAAVRSGTHNELGQGRALSLLLPITLPARARPTAQSNHIKTQNTREFPTQCLWLLRRAHPTNNARRLSLLRRRVKRPQQKAEYSTRALHTKMSSQS